MNIPFNCDNRKCVHCNKAAQQLAEMCDRTHPMGQHPFAVHKVEIGEWQTEAANDEIADGKV